MALTLTYTSVPQFIPTTVHTSPAHNEPHDRLISNDNQIAAYVNNMEASLTSQISSIPPGRIVSTALDLTSGGTYPSYTAAKDYTYTYTGSYVPLFIMVRVLLNGSSNATCRNQYRWLDSAGSPMSNYIDFVAGNPLSGGDGGAALNWTFNATIPFIVGSKAIQMQDLHYNFRAAWAIQAIVEHQISRWAEWGY